MEVYGTLIVQSTDVMRTMLEMYTTHYSYGHMLPLISGTMQVIYLSTTRVHTISMLFAAVGFNVIANAGIVT